MKKGLSCLLCWLPLVLFCCSVIPLLFVSVMGEMGMMEESTMGILLIFIFFGAILSVVAVYGVMIWLIIKTVKNETLDVTAKVLWSIGLYCLNMLIFPVYWFMYIRKE